MRRAFAWLFILWGAALLSVLSLRAIYSSAPNDVYTVVYGERTFGVCCVTYALNPRTHEANRVRLGSLRQPPAVTDIAPSGQWRYALVQTPKGFRMYFLPYGENAARGTPPLQLSDEVARGWQMQWSSREDALYYLGRGGKARFEAAFYRVSPTQTRPVRLSDFIFNNVRSIHEQSLPYTSPYRPLFLTLWGTGLASLGCLLLAGLPRDPKTA
jgi:hypothetical protein